MTQVSVECKKWYIYDEITGILCYPMDMTEFDCTVGTSYLELGCLITKQHDAFEEVIPGVDIR